ncbi:Fe(3+)-siderophore ABC transporter permease, partial [Pseudomonas aeruginosa]
MRPFAGSPLMQASPMRRRRLRAWGLLAGALLLALA